MLYPLHILGDPGVDAVFSRQGTFLSPAGDTREKPGALDLRGVGPPTVPLTGVPAPRREACTEHVLQDGGGGALEAGGPVNKGHLEHLEGGGLAAAEELLAPAADRAHALLQQCVGEFVAAQADGSDVAVEGEGLVQLQQGNIVVVLVDGGIVGGVGEQPHHLTPLLRVVVTPDIVFTCRDKRGQGAPLRGSSGDCALEVRSQCDSSPA